MKQLLINKLMKYQKGVPTLKSVKLLFRKQNVEIF